MPSHASAFVVLLGLLNAVLAAAAGAGFSLEALMSRLAEAGTVEARYTERRDSPLLAEPVELNGRIRIDPAGRFLKTTEGEQASTLRMEGDRVILRRGGEIREMQLSHYPTMRLLAEGLFALARGDAKALHEAFRIELTGSADDWLLTLEPRLALDLDDPSNTEPTGLVRLRVAGSDARFRRMVLEQSAGQRTVMTFQPAGD